MMDVLIRQVCVLSVVCGIVISLSPEGSMRKVTSFACSVVLLSCVFGGFRGLDWDTYALQTARLRERERQFLEQSTEIRNGLDRRLIEKECREYVLEQASQIGTGISDASVTVEWSLEGVWVPNSIKLWSSFDVEERQKLTKILETELGIPEERQEWIEHD